MATTPLTLIHPHARAVSEPPLAVLALSLEPLLTTRTILTMARETKLNHRSGDAEATASPAIPVEWLEDFEAAARRPLRTRMRYAFIRTYKPVLDDAPYRAFDTMEEYRRWCEENLPDWLGYGRI